ncbi:hypothetical protein [Halorussus caseinilyticus]|uniref:Uncharacterized protein n=1 Tax=Halorussus caseinilyticus TaxID=3034025 RepID=A0ABD5WPL1_9EURY|nr:hypothetical protein [Halorussus sp. DT72]
MTADELSDEQLAVLAAVRDGREPELRDVHQTLVDDEDTQFTHSPDYGDNYYNDERERVQKLLHELKDEGLADVDGRGNPWYLTAAGREAVDGV